MVKDITPTQQDKDNQLELSAELAEAIREQWPIWMELAKAKLGNFSSPTMMVGVFLMATGMMTLLAAQIPQSTIAKQLDDLFDLYTDLDFERAIQKIRDDKAEIMAYLDRLLVEQAEKYHAGKVKN